MEKTIMQNKDYDQNFDYAKKQLIQQGESPEICNRECQAAHYGRNCLQCRKPYVLHFAHNCPALSHLNRSVSAKQRGNFSLAHQDECGPDCKGYHINKGCNLCSQLFGDHFNGHWCDQKETIRGDFGPFVGVKPAKR